MLTKTTTEVRIPIKEWEKLKKNPSFTDLIEMLEDRAALREAKQVRGKDITLNRYLEKRGLRNHT